MDALEKWKPLLAEHFDATWNETVLAVPEDEREECVKALEEVMERYAWAEPLNESLRFFRTENLRETRACFPKQK